MPVVGTLTVDLVANTATFTADLGKAGNSLEDFGTKGGEAGEAVDYSMTEARHGVMMLGEEFGVHLPRGLTSFIASLGPVGAAMEAAFPFIAIALGATLLIEHLVKLHEEADKLTEAQSHYGEVSADVMEKIGDKILEVGIKTDDLEGHHLAALQKRLELIDHQSLKELRSEFDTLAGAAEKTLADLKTSWFSFSQGSTGANHALHQFKEEYDKLLSSGKEKEAADLLRGTTDQAKAFLVTMSEGKGTMFADDKQREAQEQFVGLLEDTARAAALVNKQAQGEKGYDRAEEAKKAATAEAEAAKKRIAQAKAIEKAHEELDKTLIKGYEEVVKAEAKGVNEGLAWQAKAEKAEEEADKKKQEELKKFLKDRKKLQEEFWKQDQEARAAYIDRVIEREDHLATEVGNATMRAIFAGHGLAQAFKQLGEQMIEQELDNLIAHRTIAMQRQMVDAKSAASSAFCWVMNEVPYPVNAVLAPVAAYAAFAGVMAFEEGGEIPGSGPVPITAHGGETVVTKALTDQVKSSNRGGSGGGVQVHLHASAMDAEGMDRVLTKHAPLIGRHVAAQVRKANKR